MTSTIYQVTGMTCDHCAHAVAEELKAIAGVHEVSIAVVPAGSSAVTVTSSGPLDLGAVTSALGAAGNYQLAP